MSKKWVHGQWYTSVDILRCIYTEYSVREWTPVMVSRVASYRPAFWKWRKYCPDHDVRLQGHVMTRKNYYFTLSSAFSDWSMRNKISSLLPVNYWTTSNTLKPFKVLSKSNWSVKIKRQFPYKYHKRKTSIYHIKP